MPGPVERDCMRGIEGSPALAAVEAILDELVALV